MNYFIYTSQRETMPVLSLVSNKKDVIPISYLNVQSNQAQQISLFAELPSGKV